VYGLHISACGNVSALNSDPETEKVGAEINMAVTLLAVVENAFRVDWQCGVLSAS
jgi:hypothetical protein